MNKGTRIFLMVIALLVTADGYAGVADGLDKLMNPSEPVAQKPKFKPKPKPPRPVQTKPDTAATEKNPQEAELENERLKKELQAVKSQNEINEILGEIKSLLHKSQYLIDTDTDYHREFDLNIVNNCVIKLQDKTWFSSYGSDPNKDANVDLEQYTVPLQKLIPKFEIYHYPKDSNHNEKFLAKFRTTGADIAHQLSSNQETTINEYIEMSGLFFGDREKANLFLQLMDRAAKACGAYGLAIIPTVQLR